MHHAQASRGGPTVPVSVELTAELRSAFGPLGTAAVCQAVAEGLAETLTQLGIPGVPTVQVISRRRRSIARLLRIAVNGRVCRYPTELLWRVYDYVTGRPLAPAGNDLSLKQWLKESSGAGCEADGSVQFFSRACLEAIKRRPEVLLGTAQAVTYLASLPAPEAGEELSTIPWPPVLEWGLPILQRVLAQRISIADRRMVTAVLVDGLTSQRNDTDIAEDLISRLRADRIEIRLPGEYLRELTLDDAGSSQKCFSEIRDDLYYALGMRYPPFRLVPDDTLKPRSFAFKVNDLATLPQVGLQPDQSLVNENPDRLALIEIEGSAATNPADGGLSSVIDRKFQRIARANALTTWNAVTYLASCLGAELRHGSACLITRQYIEHELADLKNTFPGVVQTARDRFSPEQITRVLRLLVAEGVSMRNLKLILGCLTDWDYVVTNPSRYIIFDDRVPTVRPPNQAWLADPVWLCAFVRTGLRRQLSHQYTRGQSTLIVYLLEPRIERLLSNRQHLAAEGNGRLDERKCERILEAVRGELNALPQGSRIPEILTTIDVRVAVREIVAQEFPQVAVLAYQELPPDLNIQPIARLSL